MALTRAIILAAGQGTRLRPLTHERPKALVPLLGKPLIERQIEILRAEGVEEIVVIGGYLGKMLEGLGVEVVINSNYETTNMVASMMVAADFVSRGNGDLLICYGDIVYTRSNLRVVLDTPGEVSVMVDRSWRKLWSLRFSDPLNDAETLKIGADGRIIEIGEKPRNYTQIEGQYTGLIRVDASRTSALLTAWDAQPTVDKANIYMTRFLQNLIEAGWDVVPAWVEAGWLEVDSVDDLLLYEQLAAEGKLDCFYRQA